MDARLAPPADEACATLETELVEHVAALGVGGGVMTPAVYDTAQVARFAPPPQGPDPALDWLVAQQDPDGGWGAPAGALSRHISTLATMLALAEHRPGAAADPLDRAAHYLRASSSAWRDAQPEDLPIGGELLLRRVLDEAVHARLDVDPRPYARVVASAANRIDAIASLAWPAGTPPLSAWEAWGVAADPREQSALGDVGTCPASTARWLASGAAGATADRARAYLERAAAATGVGVPGVVPFVFPLERMEQAFSLYALALVADRLPDGLSDALAAQVGDLEAAFHARGGLSHTDVFELDGDDTAVAAAVLATFGRAVDVDAILRFRRGAHFRTWDFEFTPSLTTTAHCVHALAAHGERHTPALRFLLERRTADGLWERDKWHTSWAYATLQCVPALRALGELEALERAGSGLCARQRPDGGFGSGAASTPIETAYGGLALALIEATLNSRRVREARAAAGAYLWSRCGPGSAHPPQRLWIGKEQYAVPRLDRSWELAALLACPPPPRRVR